MSYLFVDGAYLTEAMAAWGKKWFDQPVLFDPRSVGFTFEKVFYYDALPPIKDDETAIDHAARIAEKTVYFNRLRSNAGWHVFLGDAKRRGKGAGRHVEQKEVDVLLAVDMLTHTHRKNTDKIGLVAGDLDFRPLLEAVVREGLYVQLYCEPSHASEELKYAADSWATLDFFQIWRWAENGFQLAHPCPQMGLGGGRSDPGRDDVAIARGFLDGQAAATQFKVANMASSYLLTSEVPVADGHFAHMTSVTDKLARKLWDEVYGALEWRLTGQ